MSKGSITNAKGGKTEIFNLGNGSGFSVQEVIDAAKTVAGRPIKVVQENRRPGDPPVLVGSADKAREILAWKPAYSKLEVILEHAWRWHQRRHNE